MKNQEPLNNNEYANALSNWILKRNRGNEPLSQTLLDNRAYVNTLTNWILNSDRKNEIINTNFPSKDVNLSHTKNLIFSVAHRQVSEIGIMAKCINNSFHLKNFDLILVVNKKDTDKEAIIKYADSIQIQNKKLIFKYESVGKYEYGQFEELDEHFSTLQKYDNVIQILPDVFILDETPIVNILSNIQNKTASFIFGLGGAWCPRDLPNTDMFIMKPKNLPHNIFREWVLPEFEGSISEVFMKKTVIKHNIEWNYIKRYENDSDLPVRKCLWGCIHDHNLEHVYRLLKDHQIL